MTEILSFLEKNKDTITIIIGVLVCIITFGTFLKALFEFRLQGKQKRAELFDTYKVRLRTDNQLNRITPLLEDDKIELRDISMIDKYYFLGFYEQIAVAINSGLIKKNVAHYFFGYFAIQCWESENFWYLDEDSVIAKDEYYWLTFTNFVQTMKKVEKRRVYPNYVQKIYDKVFYRKLYRF